MEHQQCLLDFSERKIERYQGWSNSATYLTALYLRQDHGHYEAINGLVSDQGVLNPVQLQHYVDTLPKARQLQIDDWAEGAVDWAEIAQDWTEEWGPEIKSSALGWAAEQKTVDSTPVETDVLRVIADAAINDTVLLLPGQLERHLYLRVNRLLEAIGGKWNRKRGGHVFKEDPTDLVESLVLTGRYTRPDNYGFFPTPAPLVERLLEIADLRPGLSCLEPSAGDGAIAAPVAERVGPENLVAVELLDRNVETLRRRGIRVIQGDFLTYRPEQPFDRVVMNPPFSRQADIDHVWHAWSLLRPGGRLVSIMSASITFRDNRKTQAFRELLEQHGQLTPNPEGSFRTSGTMVNTVTIELSRAA